MQTLISAPHRTGKSLYCMSLIDQLSRKHPNRRIYTNIIGMNYPGVLTINSTPEKPFDWRDLPDGSIVFFDEATNALDANNEKVILENLQQFFINKTVVIVAHRLSTVKNADNIVVLQNGEIVEEGTHEILSNKKGYYYELVKNQLELGN